MTTTTIVLAVGSAGTPEQFTTNTLLRGFRIDFYPAVGNTKRSIVGIAGVDKSSLANVLRELPKVAADGEPGPGLAIEDSGAGGGNQLRASDYWGDVDNGGEKIVMVVYTK